ncbi:hypothetical protein WA026_022595 [Henosepilachna vigintioctopunctata]|uniref:Amine oxidase domain-containing protein n=1 Tax=Henosepilachna vigintioctopunctata TaxID=420089 RepID=A0AAW1UWG0_9CUCU
MKWVIICVFLVSCSSAEKIIIVGAGAAGIAAASRLLDHNITDFRILEAEDRIGGRINSLYLGNGFADLGAQYIHGEKDNLVYNLAKDYVKHDKNSEYSSVFYGGSRKIEPNLVNEYSSVMDEIADIEDALTIGEVFQARYNSIIQEKYKNDSEMVDYSKNFLRTAESMVLSVEGASRWLKPSAKTNYKECEGDQVSSWGGLGYKTILDILLRNFPNKTGYNIEKHLSLGKTVSKITQLNNTIKIRCEDSSEYDADYVVFTPSLGVLKNDHKKLFEPNLDKVKVDAIEKLGFDGVMKIIFEFSNSWWKGVDDILFVWTEEQKKDMMRDISFGPIKNGEHWLSWFYSVGEAPNNSNVLIGWLVGPMVPDVEKLTAEEMKNGTLHAMKKAFGRNFNVTEPVKVIHSKWCTNPHFRGTYSYETVNSLNHCQDTLSQPINGIDGKPRILFAGEATSPRRFSTVDGAIETGFREADRLVKILKL